MAELLKQKYDLIVLKTELLASARGAPNVHFTLQCKVNGLLTNVRKWEAHTRDMGLLSRPNSPNSVSKLDGIQLPGDVIAGLGDWLHRETDGDRPLWVHLCKPYGELRFVPWERLLGAALGVPILMLPDFIFPRPRESSSALEVALCASAPLGREDHWIREALYVSARRIVSSSNRALRLHVFTDSAIEDDARAELKPLSQANAEVIVHACNTAEQFCTKDPSSRLVDQLGIVRSPWLLWMREQLRDRSLDVVHFACHGYLSRDRGAMLFAQSPLYRTGEYLAGPVGYTELQTFLSQVGAWSSVFTSVPDDNSDAGTRALADETAQSRPGPLMMHTLAADGSGQALEDGYRFLYGRSETVPRSDALFIYCQPYLAGPESARSTIIPSARPSARTASEMATSAPAASVSMPAEDFGNDVARNDLQRDFAAAADHASALDSFFDLQQNVAPSVASTERFAEQVQLRYQQLARDGLLSKGLAEHRMNIAMDTISKLRSAVAVESNAQSAVASHVTHTLEGI